MLTKLTSDDFSPVTIEITLESKKEFDNFYSLFNTVCICENLGLPFSAIREVLDKSGIKYNEESSEILSKRLRAYYQ